MTRTANFLISWKTTRIFQSHFSLENFRGYLNKTSLHMYIYEGEWLIDWLIDWLTDWLINQLIDWLIDISRRTSLHRCILQNNSSRYLFPYILFCRINLLLSLLTEKNTMSRVNIPVFLTSGRAKVPPPSLELAVGANGNN